MKTLVTKGIKISVDTNFEGTFFKNYKIHYAFGYTITIENISNDTVQLTSRHWNIYDSLNDLEVLDGEGVIGKKPIIEPNESYTYSSGCLLTSTIGAMKGHFNMVNFSTSEKFRVYVPTFKFSAPFSQN